MGKSKSKITLGKTTSLVSWKVVGGSVIGPVHIGLGIPCQDSFGVELVDNETLIAVVCDGAGSAEFAERGAQITSGTVVTNLAIESREGSLMFEDIRPAVERAIAFTRLKIEAEINVADEHRSLNDFHTTLVGCVANGQGGWFFHIGDGVGCAVPVDPVENCPRWDEAIVSLPENGEYANETCFITQDNWIQNLRIKQFHKAELILLMSDGVMPFAMTAGCRQPDPRFMDAVDRFLLSAELEMAEKALAATLDSEGARKVSGDDKTLVWGRLTHNLS